MKSIWKGHIQFSLVTIPIQVFNAVENDTQISFNQLHKTDNGRVSYKKVCKKCDQELVVDDIVKAYEYSPDQYVVIQDEDFDKIMNDKPKSFLDYKSYYNLVKTFKKPITLGNKMGIVPDTVYKKYFSFDI